MLTVSYGIILCLYQTLMTKFYDLPYLQYGRDREDKVVRWGGHRQTCRSQVQRHSRKKVGTPQQHLPRWPKHKQFQLITTNQGLSIFYVIHICGPYGNYNWLQKVPDVRSCCLCGGGYHLPLGSVQDQVVSHYLMCDHLWRGGIMIGNQPSFTYLHRWLTLSSSQASDPGRALLWQRQREGLQRDAENHVWNCQRGGNCYFFCLLNLTNCMILDVLISKISTLDPPRGFSSCGGVCCQLFTDMQFILVGLCQIFPTEF